MEGSHISVRSGGWKQSVFKNNPTDSRIFRNQKDMPVKFSPAKYAEPIGNSSRSLVKSKILSYSHDQIVVGAEKEGHTRERLLEKKPTIQTPRSRQGTQQIKVNNLQLLKNNSQKSIDILSSPIRARVSEKQNKQTLDSLQQIKLEYLRFKEKVTNQLKKLQEDIKKAINQITAVIRRTTQTHLTSNNVGRPSSLNGKPLSFGIQGDQPVNILGSLPKTVLPEKSSFDCGKYRQLLGGESAIESVLPKIKEKMSKFFQIMGQLKSQIHDQAMYSPVTLKQQGDSPFRSPE